MRAVKNYKVFLGTQSETWQQALDRYERFRQSEMLDYFSTKDYSYYFRDNKAYDFLLGKKVSPALLADFEMQRGVRVPDELEKLLCAFGTFQIGEVFDIFGGLEQSVFPNLSKLLLSYGYESLLNQIGSGMLKSLDSFYFFFGVSFPGSDEMSFLYFSKAGTFGEMVIAPKNEQLVLKKVLPAMFNGSADKYTLDSLLENQIDRVVINALTVKGYID